MSLQEKSSGPGGRDSKPGEWWGLHLLAFFLGAGLTWYFDWKVNDLVWSLWLSSLLVGYATILATIAAGVLFAGRVVPKDSGAGAKAAAIGAGAFGGLFFFAFFSFHFCGFHAGHATFLSSFFPLESADGEIVLSSKELGAAFLNPFKLLWLAVTKIAPYYGWFLIPVLLVEGRKIIAPFRDFEKSGTDEKGRPKGASLMAAPYLNVVRMHLLIFFFAGAQALGLDHFVVFLVVYAVYFFPWFLLSRKKKKGA